MPLTKTSKPVTGVKTNLRLQRRGPSPRSLNSTCTKLDNFWGFFFFGGGNVRGHLRHMEVSRLGVELELQLPVYATATAMPDPNRVCDLYHSSRQHWIPNPLSEAGDRTPMLMDTSWVLNALSHNENGLRVPMVAFSLPPPTPSIPDSFIQLPPDSPLRRPALISNQHPRHRIPDFSHQMLLPPFSPSDA